MTQTSVGWWIWLKHVKMSAEEKIERQSKKKFFANVQDMELDRVGEV